MKRIGLTGGSGCGKTTLLQAAVSLGGAGIDCDAVYHKLLQENKRMTGEIGECFPGTVTGGVLDREKLSKIVFSDPEALQTLNRITHGYVQRETEQMLANAAKEGAPFAVIDAVGLFESGMNKTCQATIAVTAPEELRIRRLVARENISEERARYRIRAQRSDAEFSRLCDYTLVNDYETKEEFLRQCVKLLRSII